MDHQNYGTVGEKWGFYWTHFRGPSTEAYNKIINIPNNSPVVLGEGGGVCWFKEMFGLLKDQPQMPDLVLCNYLTQLLTQLASARFCPINNPISDCHRNEVDLLIQYIKDNLRQQITLEELSDKTHLSKFYLIRLFKAYTGRTPHEFIIYQRIQEAKRLLTKTDLSVSEIALTAGFHDSNHLIACFKKVVGTTPMMYRKSWPA
jgi:AraC-like DNA-binding protein